jgi:pseudaminic acid cytidylyltransferase
MKIAIIPARGGSKRVKKKNIKLFEGIPAIGRVITILSKSKIFDIIIVSTDSSEIMKIAKKYKAEVPFRRPKNISGDHSSTHAVIKHCIKWLENKRIHPEYICCVYPTAFFIEHKDLEEGYKKIKKNKCKFVFAGSKDKVSTWKSFTNDKNKTKVIFPKYEMLRTQETKDTYHDSGQFYWAKTQTWMTSKSIFSSRCEIVTIPKIKDHDIDTIEDWKFAEQTWKILKKNNV